MTTVRYDVHRWCSRVGAIAITALVVPLYPPLALSAEPDIGSITAVRGTAVLKRPGVEHPLAAQEGLAFRVGDVVETGAHSTAQMTLTDDSFMNLGPGSAVRVSQFSFDPAADRRTTIIRVIKGKTRFVVFTLRSRGSSFRVEADNALVTAGGLADFIVLASPVQTEVVVLDQGLIVRNRLPYVVGDVRVGVNQGTIIREKSPPAVPVIITPQERRNWLKDLKQR